MHFAGIPSLSLSVENALCVEEWLQVVYQFFGHLHSVSHAQLSLIGQVVFLSHCSCIFCDFSYQSQGLVVGADCSMA